MDENTPADGGADSGAKGGVGPRIAVIAVHGVADQSPRDTARDLADLLAARNDGVRYAPFEETGLRLPVRAVDVPADCAPQPLKPPRRWRVSFDERAPSIARRHAENQARKGVREDAEARRRALTAARFEVVRDQLACHEPEGADRIYASVRLRTARAAGEPKLGGNDAASCSGGAAQAGNTSGAAASALPASRVDVFELYWADLSRMGEGAVSLLSGFYQLLFHVAGLGRKTLDFAMLAYEDPAWRRFHFFHTLAERLLVLVIPMLNLCLLGLASGVLAHYLTAGWTAADVARIGNGLGAFGVDAGGGTDVSGTLLGLLALGVGGALIAALLAYRRRWSVRGSTWPTLALAVLASAVAVMALGASLPSLAPGWLAIGCWALAVGAILWLMRRYEKTRPGAEAVAEMMLGAVSLLYLVFLLARGHVPCLALAAAMDAAEWVWLAFMLAWGAFVFAVLASGALGWLAVRQVRRAVADGMEPDYREPEARDAAWTATLSVTLPGLLFSVFNLAAWMALNRLLSPLMPVGIVHEPQWPLAHALPGMTLLSEGFVEMLIRASITATFLILLALAGLVLLLVLWSVVPLVIAEVGRAGGGRASTVWYGQGLSRAFRVLRVAGLVLSLTFILGLILTVLADEWLKHHHVLAYGRLQEINLTVAAAMGTLLVLMLLGSGPLRFLALGLRAGLDIAVDVVNWLRTHPQGQTPRARITARYVALLNHVAAARPAYDGVLIVAHSQGSVITVDTLRFLREMDHPLATRFGADLPVWLMTMGCPLRQLYAPRFPGQYGWARDSRPGWPTPKPDPTELGVQQWSNCYRSGDYVGRFLWYGPEGDHPRADLPWLARPREDARTPNRRDWCIGPGAHTHYWDGSSPEVGQEVDRLIGVIAARAAAARQG